MKLNKLFVALMAVALPLGFVACSSDDDNTPYEFPAAPNKDKAATYNFPVSEDNNIQSVSFGEGNTAIIEQKKEDGSVEYIVGTYEVKDGVYNVKAADGTTYQFQVTVNGATYDVQITVGENSVTVIATKESAKVTEAPDLLNDWKPFRTKINLKKVVENGKKVENPGTATKEWAGANFQEIKEFAEEKGCHVDEDLEGYILSKVSFFGTKKFSASFTNNKCYSATWEIATPWKDNGAELKFDWEDEKSKENDFVKDGKARVKIYTQGAYKAECWFTLLSTIDDKDDKWDVELNFRLVRF